MAAFIFLTSSNVKQTITVLHLTTITVKTIISRFIFTLFFTRSVPTDSLHIKQTIYRYFNNI